MEITVVDKKLKQSKNSPRIIKKYPNRRLYDTKESHYITLEDVHKLIKREKQIQVIDASNGDDITRSTLLQIIYDQEEHTCPLFTQDLLMAILAYYNDPMHGLLSRYLEHSLSVFQDHLAEIKSPMNSLMSSKAQMNSLHNLAEESIRDWQSHMISK